MYRRNDPLDGRLQRLRQRTRTVRKEVLLSKMGKLSGSASGGDGGGGRGGAPAAPPSLAEALTAGRAQRAPKLNARELDALSDRLNDPSGARVRRLTDTATEADRAAFDAVQALIFDQKVALRAHRAQTIQARRHAPPPSLSTTLAGLGARGWLWGAVVGRAAGARTPRGGRDIFVSSCRR